MRLPFGFEITRRGGATYLRRPGPQLGRRSFTAAQNSALTHSWSSSPRSINDWLVDGLSSLRARSRDLAANSDHGKKFVNMGKGNIVGAHGIVLQARSQDPSGALDRLANQNIEAAFRDWGESEYCSMCGTLGWVDLQDLFIGSLITDGEVIFRKIYGAGPVGYSLAQVDPSLLEVTHSRPLNNGNSVVMGIEMDGWLRPIAYHFREEQMGQGTYISPNGRPYRRVPADEVFHRFIQEGVNQIRGVPWMAPGMLRAKMLSAFEEAAVVSARLGASKVGVITTPDGQYAGDGGVDPVTGDQMMDADPGSWLTLAEGQTVGGWDPAYPNGEFGDFSKSILQSLAVGFNVDYPSLSGNLEGVNYSSMRAGLVETREVWKKLQEWTIRKFVKPVYLDWLSMALLSGEIMVPSKNGPVPLPFAKEWKFKRVQFQGKRWPWVDPLKDLQAAKLAIDEGLASRSEIIRDRGRDAEDVWTEIEADNERLVLGKITVGEPAGVAVGVDDGEQGEE